MSYCKDSSARKIPVLRNPRVYLTTWVYHNKLKIDFMMGCSDVILSNKSYQIDILAGTIGKSMCWLVNMGIRHQTTLSTRLMKCHCAKSARWLVLNERQNRSIMQRPLPPAFPLPLSAEQVMSIHCILYSIHITHLSFYIYSLLLFT